MRSSWAALREHSELLLQVLSFWQTKCTPLLSYLHPRPFSPKAHLRFLTSTVECLELLSLQLWRLSTFCPSINDCPPSGSLVQCILWVLVWTTLGIRYAASLIYAIQSPVLWGAQWGRYLWKCLPFGFHWRKSWLQVRFKFQHPIILDKYCHLPSTFLQILFWHHARINLCSSRHLPIEILLVHASYPGGIRPRKC